MSTMDDLSHVRRVLARMGPEALVSALTREERGPLLVALLGLEGEEAPVNVLDAQATWLSRLSQEVLTELGRRSRISMNRRRQEVRNQHGEWVNLANFDSNNLNRLLSWMRMARAMTRGVGSGPRPNVRRPMIWEVNEVAVELQSREEMP